MAKWDVVSLDSSEFHSDVISRQSDYRRFVRRACWYSGVPATALESALERTGLSWGNSGREDRRIMDFGLLTCSDTWKSPLAATRILSKQQAGRVFLLNPHYENFVRLLFEFVRFAGASQEYLRRGVLQFINEHRGQAWRV